MFKTMSATFKFHPELVKTAITNSCSGNMANMLVSPDMQPVCQMICLNGVVLQLPEHDIG
jgi:hypothetical protein